MSCKVLNKCCCKCCKKSEKTPRLSEKLQVPRPTERVTERVLVELRSDCACVDCDKQGNLDNEQE